MALLPCLPKFVGAEWTKDLRHLLLQEVCMKWVATTIMLQLADVCPLIIPQNRKGCVLGRQMIDRLLFAALSGSVC